MKGISMTLGPHLETKVGQGGAPANSRRALIGLGALAAATSLTFAGAPSPAGAARARGALEVLNVRDFGAKGNNSTDDTSAIHAAINAAADNGGGIVFFPDAI